MAPKTTSTTRSTDVHSGSVIDRFSDTDPDFIKLKRRLAQQTGITTLARLGHGTFSVVLRAACHDGKAVAVKIIETRNGGEYVKRFLPREKEIVRTLIHPNIVRVYHVVQDSPFVIFVSEICDGGDLLQKILSMKHIPEKHAKVLFRQLMAAIEYLQSIHALHRDLKCENVFLDKNDNIKLGDFGFARFLKENEYSKTFCGSRAYVAPEVLSAEPYTGHATDIWSAGVILFVMVTGLMPFDDRDPRRMLRKQQAHSIKFPRNLSLSSDVNQLILGCLHPLPSSRLKSSQIIASTWLTGVDGRMRNAPLDRRL